MAFVIADRVKETSTTAGDGALALDGAVSGYISCVAGVGDTNSSYFCAFDDDNDEWEVFEGTVTDAAPDTLSRDTVLASSNGGALVNFSGGTLTIICTLPSKLFHLTTGSFGVGPAAFVPAYDFSIGSADGSDQIGDYHDNTNAYRTWTDGAQIFITDEGTNMNTSVHIYGKGTGEGYLSCFDEGDDEHLQVTCVGGIGRVETAGVAPGTTDINRNAHDGVRLFSNSASGETKEWILYGYNAGAGAAEHASFGVGKDAVGVLSIDDIANVAIDGNLVVGKLAASAVTGLEIASADDSDSIYDYHDNTNAYRKWTDGYLYLMTDEATDTSSLVCIQGKGTGTGSLLVYDQDDAEYLRMRCLTGKGDIYTAGTVASYLQLQDPAHADVRCFENAASGETPEFALSGYNAGAGAIEHASFGVGVDAVGVLSIDDIANVAIDGNLVVGKLAASAVTGLEIASADDSDSIYLYHDNTHAYHKWTDGNLTLMSDEGTNAQTNINTKGKGTGYGTYRAFDEDDAEYLELRCTAGTLYLNTLGAAAGGFALLNTAHASGTYFSGATEGETPELYIYGYRTGDAKRGIAIGVGVDAADTASFNDVANYAFDGNVLAGTLTGIPSANGNSVFVSVDNTADPTMAANCCGFYGKDVGGTTEAFAIDEAGNAQQLTPHDPETGEIYHFTRNGKTGRWTKIWLERVAKKLQEMFPEEKPYIEYSEVA